MGATVKLDDVAKAAGVSTATVSRVLNNIGNVSTKTRVQVETAIRELGYVPSVAGRFLATKRLGAVGVIVPTLDNAIFSHTLQALQERLYANGMMTFTATNNYDPDKEFEQITRFAGYGVDGIALVGTCREPRVYRFMKEKGVPFTLMWSWTEPLEHPTVGFDNFAAACDIARLVVGYGHRRVAVISGQLADNDRMQARLAGIAETLTSCGIDFDPETNHAEADFSFKAVKAPVQTLLDKMPDLTAIMCANDVIAAGVILELRERGIQVPEQISVTGFDDIDLASVIEPPITTVRIPHRRMGNRAAEMLLSMVRGETPENTSFEPHLLVRKSLGMCPS